MNAKALQDSKTEIESQINDLRTALEAINRILGVRGTSAEVNDKEPMLKQLGIQLRSSVTVNGCQYNIRTLDAAVKSIDWGKFPPIYRQRTMERRNSEAWKLRKLQRVAK